MNCEDENGLPSGAKKAFEAYPNIEPSAAFNRAVLERLELEGKRRNSLVGLIEEFLGLDLWRFAATGMLGALLPGLLLGACLLTGRSPASSPSPTFNNPTVPPEIQRLNQFYAREMEEGMPLPPLARKPKRPLKKPQSGDEISWLDSKSQLG